MNEPEYTDECKAFDVLTGTEEIKVIIDQYGFLDRISVSILAGEQITRDQVEAIKLAGVILDRGFSGECTQENSQAFIREAMVKLYYRWRDLCVAIACNLAKEGQ